MVGWTIEGALTQVRVSLRHTAILLGCTLLLGEAACGDPGPSELREANQILHRRLANDSRTEIDRQTEIRFDHPNGTYSVCGKASVVPLTGGAAQTQDFVLHVHGGDGIPMFSGSSTAPEPHSDFAKASTRFCHAGAVPPATDWTEYHLTDSMTDITTWGAETKAADSDSYLRLFCTNEQFNVVISDNRIDYEAKKGLIRFDNEKADDLNFLVVDHMAGALNKVEETLRGKPLDEALTWFTVPILKGNLDSGKYSKLKIRFPSTSGDIDLEFDIAGAHQAIQDLQKACGRKF